MTLTELPSNLLTLRIRYDAYWLKGGLPVEAYCLGYCHNLWEIYYSERGQKTGLKKFDSEGDACEYFLALIPSDRSLFPKPN